MEEEEEEEEVHKKFELVHEALIVMLGAKVL